MTLKKPLILITGASGCVGQYITHWLLENSNADLLLLIRFPEKIKAFDLNNPRIKTLVSDLRDISLYSEQLKSVTRVIHTATAWGDPKRAYEVNVVAVKELLESLNLEVLEQIIYFSTASVLDKNLQLLPEASLYGTEYIQTKAQCLLELESHPLAEKIIAVFPTLVFGGRVDGKSSFPTSYLTAGLLEAVKWLWLARWIKGFSRFHFIHAADIAYVCGHLATTKHQPNKELGQGAIRRLVLAQPSLSIDQAVNDLLIWRSMRRTPQLPLWNWLVQILIWVLPIQLTSWDRFSIKQRHFEHEPISPPENFGGKSFASSLENVLEHSGLLRIPKIR